jgi:hypothetical protein
MVEELQEVTVSITLSDLKKIYELLEQIEHPQVWYCDQPLQMANDAIRDCAQTAIQIKMILPVVDFGG